MNIQKRSEDRKINQATLQPNPVDRSVKIAPNIVHHYHGTQYCSTEAILLIFPFLQTNIISQMRCGQVEVRGKANMVVKLFDPLIPYAENLKR